MEIAKLIQMQVQVQVQVQSRFKLRFGSKGDSSSSARVGKQQKQIMELQQMPSHGTKKIIVQITT